MFNFNLFKHKRAVKNGTNVQLGYLDKRVNILRPLFMILPALAIVITFTIVPFVISAQHSFEYLPNKHDKTVTATGTQEWTKLLNDPFFRTSLRNSMLYAFLSVPLVLTVSMIISAVIASLGRK